MRRLPPLLAVLTAAAPATAGCYGDEPEPAGEGTTANATAPPAEPLGHGVALLPEPQVSRAVVDWLKRRLG